MEDNIDYTFPTPPKGTTRLIIEYIPDEGNSDRLPTMCYDFPPGATITIQGGDTDLGDAYAHHISIEGLGMWSEIV